MKLVSLIFHVNFEPVCILNLDKS